MVTEEARVATAEWQAAAQRSADLRRRARRAITPWAVGVAALVSAATAVAWVGRAPTAGGTTTVSATSQDRALRADRRLINQLASQTQAEQRRLAALGGAQAAIPALPPPAHATTGASGVP